MIKFQLNICNDIRFKFLSFQFKLIIKQFEDCS